MNAVEVTVLCSLLLTQCPSAGAEAGSGCNLGCESGHPHWGYGEENGPECWGSCDTYDTCNSGFEQSPINIETSAVTRNEECGCDPLRLTGYDQKREMTMINDGHSAKIQLKPRAYKVKGIGLEGKYVADSLHFHWGENNDEGSEHQIDGDAAPLEMHIVHYSNQYGSLGEALGNDGGVAVLGFLFRVAPNENKHFENIVDNLQNIRFKGSQIELPNMKLCELLPDWSSGIYFRYRGSLTTPSCTEGLVWTVFADTIPISEGQLQAFRSTINAEEQGSTHNHVVTHNFRPTQPLNGRAVTMGTVSCYDDSSSRD